MTFSKLPRIALWLALALVVWFAFAAFGPKFGLIDWQTGLMTMIGGAGLFLIGGVAVIALVALVASLIRAPRTGWWRAAIALAIPLVFAAGLMNLASTAQSVPPIHDITTDTANPPQFSASTMATREQAGANPVRGFETPLGQFEEWATTPVADQTAAALIADSYPDVGPLLTDASADEALVAVAVAMDEIGLSEVDSNDASVWGVAETFAFGFKDDVVARVTSDGGKTRVDFRSTSRVGLSDLGYNAARIVELREITEDVLKN